MKNKCYALRMGSGYAKAIGYPECVVGSLVCHRCPSMKEIRAYGQIIYACDYSEPHVCGARACVWASAIFVSPDFESLIPELEV